MRDVKGSNNPMFGKKHSDETIQKFKETRVGQYSGNANPMFGKAHSEQAREKVSLSRKGKLWINNGMVTKSIEPEELTDYLNNGWKRGRSMDKRASKKYIIRNFYPIDKT